MRIGVELDEKSLEELKRFAGADDVAAAAQFALADWLRIKSQLEALDSLRGIGWEGDLEEMRNNWSSSAAE